MTIPRVSESQLLGDRPTARSCQLNFSPWFIFNLKVTTSSFSTFKWIVGSYWSVLEWATSNCKQTSKSSTFIFFCHFQYSPKNQLFLVPRAVVITISLLPFSGNGKFNLFLPVVRCCQSPFWVSWCPDIGQCYLCNKLDRLGRLYISCFIHTKKTESGWDNQLFRQDKTYINFQVVAFLRISQLDSRLCLLRRE